MNLQRWFGTMVAVAGFIWMSAGDTAWAQDPVVHWTFDETAGGTVDALDTGSGAATNGMFGATATRTTDTPGGGAGFSVDLSAPGTSSIIDGGNPIEVDTLAQFTFSTWAKVTGATHYNEGGSVNVRLLAKQSNTPLFDGFSWNMNAPDGLPSSQDAFRMGLFIGGELDFDFAFATENILDRGGDWLFLAVSYDGNSTVDNARFYVGDENTPVAQLGDPTSINAGPVYPSNTSNGGDADARFGVGFTDAAPTADTSLTGYQDDVRVYDSVLDLAALDAVRLANLPGGTGLDGDYNGDGRVDAADYVVWRKTDGTGPGYDAWVANFGQPQAAGSGSAIAALSQTAVPEPTGLILIAVGSLVLSCAVRGCCEEQK